MGELPGQHHAAVDLKRAGRAEVLRKGAVMTRSFVHARSWAAALVLPFALLVTRQARAHGTGESTAVIVEGPKADQVAGWIEDRVQAPDTLVEDDAFREALRTRKALPLRAATASAARDAQLIARVRSAAREHNVDRAVLVDMRPTSGASRVHVWAVDLRHPGALVDTEITLPATATAIDETRAILGLLPPSTSSPDASSPAADSQPPPPPTESPAPTSPPATAPVPDADRVAGAAGPHRAPPPITLQAALGVGMRHFSYVDRISPALRPYDLDAAPLAAVSAAIYPLAFTRVPVLRDLGLTGEYAHAFGVSSEDATGTLVGTTWQSFDVGAIERIPLARSLTAHLSLGYGGDDFQFTQSLASAALPGVAYRFVRAGGDLRFEFLRAFAAFAGGSYLDILDTGATGQLFPRETVGGVEAHVGASFAVTPHWQASVGAAYTRFFYSFNPVPGDASVAGGALDEQTRVLAAFAYLM
jgi:hypothetical protein